VAAFARNERQNMTGLRSAIVVVTALVGWSTLQAQQKKAAFEAEVIHITPKAIFPQAMTRKPGPFALVIKNYTSLKQLVVTVQPRSNGPAVFRHNMDDDNGSASGVLNLAPGVYDLVVSGQPSLQCTITITP
jgi:hypothetical protein